MFILKSDVLFLYFCIYICLIIISCVISYKKNNQADNILFIVVIFIYVLFIFSRDGYGVDEPTYLIAYVDYLQAPSDFRFDYSFELLYWIFSEINISTDIFNEVLVCSFLLLASLCVYLYSLSSCRSLVLIMLLFSSVYLDLFFNAYRQAYALLFFLLSLKAYQLNKNIAFIVLATISLGFHWSVLVVILLYFISQLINVKWLNYILIISFLLTFFAIFRPVGIIDMIVFIVNEIPPIVFGENLSRILMYLNSTENSFYSLNLLGRLPLALPVLVMLAFCFIFRDVLIKSKFYPLVIFLSIYGVLLLEMAFSFRNYYWMLPLFPFIFHDFLCNSKHKYLFSRYFIVCILNIALTILTFFSSPLLPIMFSI